MEEIRLHLAKLQLGAVVVEAETILPTHHLVKMEVLVVEVVGRKILFREIELLELELPDKEIMVELRLTLPEAAVEALVAQDKILQTEPLVLLVGLEFHRL
jgi:hypothetical protein